MPTDFCKNYQRGITLIEVLVTIVILAVGILGLAGLQASGLRVGSGAMYRGIAAQFTDDMADRMRANAALAKSGSYNRGLSDTFPTGTDVASVDVADWLTRLKAALPGAAGAVNVPANSNVATITIQWDDRRAAVRDANPSAAQTAQFLVTTQLWSSN